MGLGVVIEPPAHPADATIAYEPGQGHTDGARIAQIGEVVWRKHPATAMLRNTAHDLLVISWLAVSAFHVENNALFFQQVNRPGVCCRATPR